ncbi:hypothetical protein D3C74_412460 [compost metagenome]
MPIAVKTRCQHLVRDPLAVEPGRIHSVSGGIEPGPGQLGADLQVLAHQLCRAQPLIYRQWLRLSLDPIQERILFMVSGFLDRFNPFGFPGRKVRGRGEA